jgi:hypothetical protein
MPGRIDMQHSIAKGIAVAKIIKEPPFCSARLPYCLLNVVEVPMNEVVHAAILASERKRVNHRPLWGIP